MCLPMTPAGPDSEVMKPIFSGSAARAGPASSPAMRARRTAPLNVRTVASFTSEQASSELANWWRDSSMTPPPFRGAGRGTSRANEALPGPHISGRVRGDPRRLAGLVRDQVEADGGGPAHLALGVDRGHRHRDLLIAQGHDLTEAGVGAGELGA